MVKTSKTFFKYNYFSLIILGVFLIFILNILVNMESMLVYEKPLDKVDVIVVLSGESGTRVKKAVELYDANVSTLMIMTGGPRYLTTDPDLMKEYAAFLGVSKDHIFIETESYSTRDHVLNLDPIFKEKNIRSVLIVTSLFHTKRSYEIFSSYYGDELEIGVSGANDNVNYSQWWRDFNDIEVVLIEFFKSIFYTFFY